MTLEKQDALLRVRTVLQLTAISRASVYRLMAQGDFPQPVQIGPRAVAWRLSELNDWIASRKSGVRPAGVRPSDRVGG